MAELPIWLTWGQQQTIEAISGGVVTTQSTSGQIGRIDFDRPESWAFFLAAIPVEGIGVGGGPIAPGNIKVDFAIIFGIGQSSITIPTIQTFNWTFLVGAFPNGRAKYSADVQPPLFDDAVVAVAPPIARFVAQSISISATVTLNTPAAGDRARMTVHSYFCPQTHVRKAWFE